MKKTNPAMRSSHNAWSRYRSRLPHTRPRPTGGAFAVLALAGLLSGCGLSQLTSGLGSSVFGRKEEPAGGWKTSVTEENLLAAAKADSGGPVAMGDGASQCPPVKVWPADRHVTAYMAGQVGDSMAIRYRGDITKTARECQILPDRVNVKYGFAGRVLLGPAGHAGSLTLPVKLYVADNGGKQLQTEIINVRVNVSPDDPVAYFSIVRVIRIPLAPGMPAQSYRLFVGFDQKATPGAS